MGVGTFPTLGNPFRRTVRAEINPMDKSTIFSIYPKHIVERHSTVIPSRYEIPAGTFAKPSSVVVGPASWWKETHPEEPLIEIVNGSPQVARAVVENFCSGLPGFVAGTAQPGLFWVPGEWTVDQLKTDFKLINALAIAKKKQDEYYTILIQIADEGWSKTNGSPLSISEDMRLAARELGATKDWMNNFALVENVKCIACGSPRNPQFPVCPSCKAVVDKKKAEELGITFAN